MDTSTLGIVARRGVHVGARGYPPEFQAEAVKLWRESGRSQREVAKDLGVSYETLRTWVRRDDADAGRRSDVLTTDERDELKRLRRDNRTLRMERDLLKKAAAFFAKEGESTR
jgi:transposase